MHKKVFIFIFCILGGQISAKAQVGYQTDSLYIAALSYYLITCDSNHQKFPHIYPQIDTLFLERTDEIKEVPSVIEGKAIIELTKENFRKTYRKHRNRLTHTKVFPIEIIGSEIEITIIPYHGAWGKKTLSLALSDWTSVYFKYDCDKRSWVFSRVETGGI